MMGEGLKRIFVIYGLYFVQEQPGKEEETGKGYDKIGADDETDVFIGYSFAAAKDKDLQDWQGDDQQEDKDAGRNEEPQGKVLIAGIIVAGADQACEKHLKIVQLEGEKKELVGVAFNVHVMDIAKTKAVCLF